MTDREIAARFRAIADILEIQGELVFKVRAYRIAADTIDGLEDDELTERHEAGTLKDLSGFGPAIVSKTSDFLTTGTTAIWERIKDSVPLGVVQLASVPGIGPKTAKALWEGLNVTTVEEVEQAAHADKIRALAGFGAAKEAQILEKIAAWRRLNERIPRYKALTIAGQLAAELRKIPGVEHVEIGGELRRGYDEVSEIVLGVYSPDLPVELPELPAYVRCSVVAGKGKYGWGDQQIADIGPDSFAQKVADLTDPNDMEIAEDDGSALSFANMPYIAPELRDWPNIIELAKAGQLPKLIEASDMRGELHEHTVWSDGGNTVREMAEAALARGYEYLAITDHSPLVGVANGLNRDRLLQQIDEMNSLRAEFAARGLQLLTGQEVDILADGGLDMDDDVLAQLDIVVASVHMRYKLDEAAMTARMVRALENPYTRILGHPTGRLLGRREPYAVDMDAIVEAAAKHNKALEINSTPDRMDLKDEHVKKAKAAGVKISINCDAHSTSGLGDFHWGLSMARRAGLEADDVINTYSWERLQAWLKR